MGPNGPHSPRNWTTSRGGRPSAAGVHPATVAGSNRSDGDCPNRTESSITRVEAPTGGLPGDAFSNRLTAWKKSKLHGRSVRSDMNAGCVGSRAASPFPPTTGAIVETAAVACSTGVIAEVVVETAPCVITDPTPLPRPNVPLAHGPPIPALQHVPPPDPGRPAHDLAALDRLHHRLGKRIDRHVLGEKPLEHRA